MAPEFPPRLVVLDLAVENGDASATVEYVEHQDPAHHLRVRWAHLEVPHGYRPVANGFVYVEESDELFTDGPHSVVLDRLGENRFRWIQGTPGLVPWIMIALIMPPGYTLARPRPKPQAAKLFKDRIGAYWVLSGDAHGRTTLEWSLERLDKEEAEAEIRTINSGAFKDPLPSAARLDVESDEVVPVPNRGVSESAVPAAATLHQPEPAARAGGDAPKDFSEAVLRLVWNSPWRRVLLLSALGLAVLFAIWNSLPDAVQTSIVNRIWN